MLSINTNLSALQGLRDLNSTARNQSTAIERLSTGYRINRASDDPAGLVISEKLRAQIKGIDQALENTQNDINLLNTAEGALQNINDILVDIRSSIIFAMNSGFSIPEQIEAEQDSVDQALLAIDRIAQTTRFANRNLLNGDSDFIVEQDQADRAALDSLSVRQLRFTPSQEQQNFSVNVTNLAERATLISNQAFDSQEFIATGSGSDFATIRVTGSRGSEDINFGATAKVTDLVNAINQNATSTGVFASSYQTLPMDSTVNEVVLRGAGSVIDLGAFNDTTSGASAVQLGVEVEGVTTNILLEDSDFSGTLNAAELQTAFDDAYGTSSFVVDTDANGDLRIWRGDNIDFSLGAATSVRKVTITAEELSTLVDADGDGNIELTLDLGDGNSSVALGNIAVSANGLPFGNEEDDRQVLLDEIIGSANWPATGGAYFNVDGDLILTDSGTTFGAAPGPIVLAGQSGQDTGNITKEVEVLDDTTGLSVLGLSPDGAAATERGLQFVNLAVGDNHVSEDGLLQIDTTLLSANSNFDFEIFDPEAGAYVQVGVTPPTGPVVNGNNTVTVEDVQAGLRAAMTTGDNWSVYFSAENGLSVVYNPNASLADYEFGIQNDATGSTNDLSRVTNTAAKNSTENSQRLALYSLDFGSDEVVTLEDVTSATSAVQFTEGNDGGLTFTSDERAGLGIFAGSVNTLTDLTGSKHADNGADAEGTINGLAFNAKGFDAQLVTAAADMSFTLAETYGKFGDFGRAADAGAFGLETYYASGVQQFPQAAQTNGSLPIGVLDSFEFTVRQNYDGGPRGTSGLKFQIRETNTAQDSLTIGIKGVTTGQLGLDVDPESGDANSAQRINSFNGGALNTLRSGAGNDLFSNPENALEIVDAAINQVTDLRGFIGSITKDTLQRNLDAASVAMENLISSESEIRDIDFAEQTTEFARQQVLYAAGTSVLASANQLPGQLLQLLQ